MGVCQLKAGFIPATGSVCKKKNKSHRRNHNKFHAQSTLLPHKENTLHSVTFTQWYVRSKIKQCAKHICTPVIILSNGLSCIF